MFAEGFGPKNARIPRCADTIDTKSSLLWLAAAPGGSRTDKVPTVRTAAVAERRGAKPLLGAVGVGGAAIANDSIVSLAVVVRRFGADVGRDANVIRRVGLPPHEALKARVRAVGAAVGVHSAGGCGVVGCGPRARRGSDAHVVIGTIGLAPDVAWMGDAG